MEKKFNNIISIEKITVLLLHEDLQALGNIESLGIQKTDIFNNGIQKLEDCFTLEEIVKTLGELFDELANAGQYNLAMIIQTFMQRYGFFSTTNNDYLNYTKDFKVDLIKPEPALTFAAVFSPFFTSQIDFYLAKFLETLEMYPVKEWNQTFYNKVKSMDEKCLTNNDFSQKLGIMEDFILFLQNVDNIYNDLDIKENDAEKQAFLVQINELKIVLQSIDILIEKVLRSVVLASKEVQ